MVQSSGKPKRIGDLLVEKGLVAEYDINLALQRQRNEGGRLGKHLIIMGFISRLELYQTLAEQWQAPLLDLLKEPPSASRLVSKIGHKKLNDQGWLPWRYDGTVLTVATSVEPTAQLEQSIIKQTGISTIRYRTTTDWDVTRALQELARNTLLYSITDALADEHPDESAKHSMVFWQKATLVAFLGLSALFFVLYPIDTFAVFFLGANLVFFLNIAFKVLFGLRSPFRVAQKQRWKKAIQQQRAKQGLIAEWDKGLSDDELPMYTILVPVFKEVEVVSKVISNLSDLDYPKTKLDILILLEENDHETIAAAKAAKPPEYVRILVVPEGQPQTKPRACNYGLEFARGQYVVIFDAEDKPDPDQLRKAIAAFELNRLERETLDPNTPRLVCSQAALSYFNSEYNALTKLFSVEYAHWYDAMLPGLDQSGIPLPLGGTSNHFEVETLKELGGWDPWNVTEDADLGLRIAARGYSVGTIESSTQEEACAEIGAWIKQRTRWIKGYMVTAAVNTRKPITWYRRNGFSGLLGMFGLILGTPLAFLAYPVALLFTIVTYIGVQLSAIHIPPWVLEGGMLLMLFGNGAMILTSGMAAWRRYNWRVGIMALLNPVYWTLHAVAAWRAAWQMIFDPHRWEKTPHGLTEDYESSHEHEIYTQYSKNLS